MTEKEKMMSGEMYDAYDLELCVLREQCRLKVEQLNKIDASKKRNVKKLSGRSYRPVEKTSFS